MMSNEHFGQWYTDRTPGDLVPDATLWSAPIWIYKGLMLIWALWLAASLVHWLRWGWVAFRKGQSYRPRVPGSARGTRAAAERTSTGRGAHADSQGARAS